MKFPNKVNLYRDTIVFTMVIVYIFLGEPIKPSILFMKVKSKMPDGILSFQDALACLYAMGKIEINDKGEIFKC